MASISSAGIGSGLDINGIISKLMAVEQQPLTALATKEADYQAQLSAFGSLKGAVSALQTAVTSLKSTSLYNSMSAQSSDTTVFAASANTAATRGNYALEVVDVAKAQSLASTNFASHTSAISTIDGKIKIEIGTFSGGTFAADSTKPPATISITAGNSSLDSIRDSINAANVGVRANIVYVGTAGYKLTLTSTSTGAASSMKLTVMDSSDNVLTNNTDLAKLSYDPTKTAGTGNEYAATSPAQDAHIKVDGLDLYRSSNTITDAITGVTLTASKIGTASLTVSQDTNSIITAIQGFVTAFNDTNTQLRTDTTYNATTKTASVLTGDSGARSLQTALRSMISTTFNTSTAGLNSLTSIGVTIQRDGSLQFDSSKLTAALQSSPNDVAALFTASTGSKGIAMRMDSVLSSMLSSSGLFASRTDGINRTITDIGRQRDALNLRLTQIEKNYRTQFTALDTLVASMQATQNYLTQQLANLPTTSTTSK